MAVMHLDARITRGWRCTQRPRDRENSEMHLEARIQGVCRCTWKLRSCELSDALGGRRRASLEIHLETERLSELRDGPRGRD
jgi:hypothetical protein